MCLRSRDKSQLHIGWLLLLAFRSSAPLHAAFDLRTGFYLLTEGFNHCPHLPSASFTAPTTTQHISWVLFSLKAGYQFQTSSSRSKPTRTMGGYGSTSAPVEGIWWSSLDQQTTKTECIFTLNLKLGPNPPPAQWQKFLLSHVAQGKTAGAPLLRGKTKISISKPGLGAPGLTGQAQQDLWPWEEERRLQQHPQLEQSHPGLFLCSCIVSTSLPLLLK